MKSEDCNQSQAQQVKALYQGDGGWQMGSVRYGLCEEGVIENWVVNIFLVQGLIAFCFGSIRLSRFFFHSTSTF